jgi:hypothetical protein
MASSHVVVVTLLAVARAIAHHTCREALAVELQAARLFAVARLDLFHGSERPNSRCQNNPNCEWVSSPRAPLPLEAHGCTAMAASAGAEDDDKRSGSAPVVRATGSRCRLGRGQPVRVLRRTSRWL